MVGFKTKNRLLYSETEVPNLDRYPAFDASLAKEAAVIMGCFCSCVCVCVCICSSARCLAMMGENGRRRDRGNGTLDSMLFMMTPFRFNGWLELDAVDPDMDPPPPP